MGNCFTLPASPSLSSSSSSSCSSSRLTSLCSVSSHESCPILPTTSAPRRILPFPTLSDLTTQYQLSSELGRGQFGVIRLCTCRSSNTLFACKSLSKLRAQNLPDILREVRIMQRLSRLPSRTGSHPIDIVRLHQVIEDTSHVHLVMELCNGGELFDRIVKKKRCTEPRAAAIIRSLMQSIQVCHQMGVMHRDIKPENILLLDDTDSSPIRLADFGLALEFSPGEKFSGMAGSAYYIAPEVLQGEYAEEIDIWSTGVVLYVMLSGVPPFWGETEKEIFDAIRKGNLEFAHDPWMSISASAKDLISRMLCADVKARLTPAQVLEHPWILQHTEAPKDALQTPCQTNTSISNAQALKPDDLNDRKLLAVPSTSPTPSNDIVQAKPTRVPAAETPRSSPPAPFEDDEQKLALRTKTSGKVGKQTLQHSALHSTTVSNADNQALQASHVDTSVKTDADALSMALVAKFNIKCLPIPESIAEMSVQGCALSRASPTEQISVQGCALLNVSPTEQIFVVEVGKKGYLISYDSRRKTGWKILGQHHNKGFSSSVHVRSTHPQPIVV